MSQITAHARFMICANKSHIAGVWSSQHECHACLEIEYTSRVESCSNLKKLHTTMEVGSFGEGALC